MASDKLEAFWFDYFYTNDSKSFLHKEYSTLMNQNREMIVMKQQNRIEEIKMALKNCSNGFKKLIEPRIEDQILHIALKSVLDDIKVKKVTLEEELLQYPEIMDSLSKFSNSSISSKSKDQILQDFELLYDKKSHSRSWKDMPNEKLQERISHGEILPRDEWIPSITNEKRKLDSSSINIHIEFSEKVLSEGREAYNSQNYEKATTLFSQGINSLNWIEAQEKDAQYSLEKIYQTLMKNHALSCLKTGNFSIAINTCNKALSINDNFDGKVLWIRAKAYLLLGKIDEAREDFLLILKSPQSLSQHKLAAQKGLKNLKSIVNKNNSEIYKIFNKSLDEVYFSNNRNFKLKTETTKNANSSLNNSIEEFKIDNYPLDEFTTDNNSKINNNNSEDKILTNKIKDIPLLSSDETICLLQDLLNKYTDIETIKLFKIVWNKADYDERRILIRMKNILPKIQAPLFQKYGFLSINYEENLKTMEHCVRFWSSQNKYVKKLQEDCWKALLGDVGDFN